MTAFGILCQCPFLAESTYWCDVAALQSLDGKYHFPEAAGSIGSTVTIGQEETAEVIAKNVWCFGQNGNSYLRPSPAMRYNWPLSLLRHRMFLFFFPRIIVHVIEPEVVATIGKGVTGAECDVQYPLS